MPGQIPGSAGGPVFQPRFPPPQIAMRSPDVPTSTHETAPGIGITTGHSNTGTKRQNKPALVLRTFNLTWNSPSNFSISVLLSVTPNVTPTSSDAASMTVQFETAADAAFTTEYVLTNLTGQSSGVAVGPTLGPFTNNAWRYFRARAGTAAEGWSNWVGVRVMVATSSSGDYFMALQNVGLTISPTYSDYEQAYQNVGFTLTPPNFDIHNGYEGDVNTNPPTPWLWAVWPTAARAGEGATVYGHGLGATQPTYSGVIQMYLSGVWTNVSVVSWTLVAASANAYTVDRQINPAAGIVDPEHIEVAFTVHSSAVPPGHQVRAQTTT